MSYPRRHYPTDQSGGKNEWKALVQHYEEVDHRGRLAEEGHRLLFEQEVRDRLGTMVGQKEQALQIRAQRYPKGLG